MQLLEQVTRQPLQKDLETAQKSCNIEKNRYSTFIPCQCNYLCVWNTCVCVLYLCVLCMVCVYVWVGGARRWMWVCGAFLGVCMCMSVCILSLCVCVCVCAHDHCATDDFQRVCLRVTGRPGSDYINASWISVSPTKHT